MEDFRTEYGVTYVGDVQDGEEQEFWLDEKGLMLLGNECSDDTFTKVIDAMTFLRDVGYSIRIEHIPEVDSAGFDSAGFNHYQDKLNRYPQN